MSRRKKIILLLCALVFAGLVVAALLPAPAEVSAVEVRRGPFVAYVEDEGRTRLRDSYPVLAPIGGYLRRVALEPGDPVAAGDVVFTIEPSPAPALDARMREQARETLAAARARLDAAHAEHAERTAQAQLAESEVRRYQPLYEAAVVSAAEMDVVRRTWERSRAAVRAAAAAVEAARHEVETARAVVEIAEGTRSPEDERLLRVRAPVSGVVLSRERCCEGIIHAGDQVLAIGNLAEDLEIQVDLLSMDAVRVPPDARVIITRWGGESDLEGRVRRIEPAGFKRVSALGVDEWRVPVLVEITSPRQDWRTLGEGFRIEARFILWEGEEVVQVPIGALFRVDDAWQVFVVEEGRARLRSVEPGRRSGLWTQILEGLEPGELVITHPGAQIDDGRRVRVEQQPFG
ncbi:efflux RND transporter periplasmic adaptor subunit [Geoalkalibacter halelectricus]|uniref:HlyD family efflux transporter periplasmic adaptor subunit n=1 Tax=Geoalkalibacter halelectricus TaxID=2847045 RepID=A0ABY5ZLV5_9BACT|nr:HlyD family efflux transporter periplasmic adaptor subunit [Geoalkalibacter halelectricus]MDO3378570.1 HlyD family efflux transporter periplasmic adaptor subunit [Geoalkalibacter halelectricus]UWZ80116.1 HlyD family efflux transporter periplasmic adaptor subunit [Geoalkalibacter halelectricus]